MAYTKQTWSDYPSGGTPISAARLNHIEQGIYDASLAGSSTDGVVKVSDFQALQTKVNNLQTQADSTKVTADTLARTLSSSTAFTAASGWSVNRQQARKIGRLASCDISLDRTGGTITVSASGNIVNTLVGTFTSDFTTAMTYQGIASGPGGALATFFISGTSVYLAAYAPSNNITNGTEVTFAGPWMTT